MSVAGHTQQRTQAWLLLCIALVAGTLNVWLLIGWRGINPLNLAWLSGDVAQSEAGWEFLRHEPNWYFPLTWISRLDFPTGISASYLDIIPPVALALRVVSPLLPTNFQYLGLYAVFCYVMQAYYGLNLTSLFARDDFLVVLVGGGFFLLSPILMNRLATGHFALLTQWPIVACLYYYFRASERRDLSFSLAPFLVLTAISAAISPYVALMTVALGEAAVYRSYRKNTPGIPGSSDNTAITRVRSKHIFYGSLIIFVAMVFFILFGFIAIGATQFAGGGYTTYSMNMLSPVNAGGHGIFLKPLESIGQEQAVEGYNYLGIGVLFLLFVAMARRPQSLFVLLSDHIRPLIVACIILTLLALSLRITFGRYTLLDIKVPRFVFNLFGIFRSSGRLFWPVYYLLVVAGISGFLTTVQSKLARRIVLICALLLQYFDTLHWREDIAAAAQRNHAEHLVAADWSHIQRHHRNLVVLPAFQCGSVTPESVNIWPELARLAARSGLTLNSVYAARLSPRTEALDCDDIPGRIRRTGFRPDTAYVLSDAVMIALTLSATSPPTHYCRRVDGLNLCTYDPLRAGQSRLLIRALVPAYTLGTEFLSANADMGSAVLENFDRDPVKLPDRAQLGKSMGRWSAGSTAAIYFRPVGLMSQSAQLELSFDDILVTEHHEVQRVLVTINGQSIGMLEFRWHGDNHLRTLTIPAGLLRNETTNAIRFQLPDATTPRNAGLDADGPPIAISLRGFRIVATRN